MSDPMIRSRVRLPADVELEDKLAFGLTARQLLLLGGAAALTYALYTVASAALPLPVAAALCAPLAIAGTVLALAATRGSSSSSAIMLELLARGIAPAALLLGEPDAILALGVVVGREMGYPTIPVLAIPAAEQALLPQGMLRIAKGGVISVC